MFVDEDKLKHLFGYVYRIGFADGMDNVMFRTFTDCERSFQKEEMVVQRIMDHLKTLR